MELMKPDDILTIINNKKEEDIKIGLNLVHEIMDLIIDKGKFSEKQTLIYIEKEFTKEQRDFAISVLGKNGFKLKHINVDQLVNKGHTAFTLQDPYQRRKHKVNLDEIREM